MNSQQRDTRNNYHLKVSVSITHTLDINICMEIYNYISANKRCRNLEFRSAEILKGHNAYFRHFCIVNIIFQHIESTEMWHQISAAEWCKNINFLYYTKYRNLLFHAVLESNIKTWIYRQLKKKVILFNAGWNTRLSKL